MTGCLNINAVNYNASADTEDYSCKYLMKNAGICHLFQDVVPPTDLIDRSFTMSYSVRGGSWVFFHDYIADFYFHTRENLFSVKGQTIYKHNDGQAGQYYVGTKPYFIDIIFRADGDMLLESVQWVSEFLSSATDNRFSTLTHLSIWNSTQHSGRISLTQLFKNVQYDNVRRTKGEWSFHDFKDVLADSTEPFLKSIFENYLVEPTSVAVNPAWYDQGDIQDSWFCVRFEFDNTSDAQVVIHDTTIQALKTDR